jgi:hypothetical protein
MAEAGWEGSGVLLERHVRLVAATPGLAAFPKPAPPCTDGSGQRVPQATPNRMPHGRKEVTQKILWNATY